MSSAARRAPRRQSARQALAAVALVLVLRDVAQVPAASLQPVHSSMQAPRQPRAASPLHGLRQQRQRRARRTR
jgi:hypothetical protein